MKILFLIASINSKSQGLGGHYQSLMHTANELSIENEVVVINIGNQKSESLSKSSLKVNFVKGGLLDIVKTYNKLKAIACQENPDVIHAFDRIAHFWGRFLSHEFKVNYVLTKCGGPNSPYFPYSKNLIVFSQENLEHFKLSSKFNKSNIFLVPNRVKSFEDDSLRIKRIHEKIDDDHFKFLRITRISKFYKKSSIQLVDLVNKLNEEGLKCCAIFVGIVQDETILEELKRLGGKNAHFFNDIDFSQNAKEIISVADAVLGTGRSLMEATSKGKVVLCPAENTRYPVLLNDKIFDIAFHYNFSERIKVKQKDEITSLDAIKEIITSENFKNQAEEFSLKMFNTYFNIEKAPELFREVYAMPYKKSATKLKDILLHFALIVRTYTK